MATEVKLTDKQIRFCEEYVIDWNASRSAIAAGYSEKTAYSIGQENLKKPEIVEYIDKIKNDLSRLSGVTALRNINELAKVAYSNIIDMVDNAGQLKPYDELTPSEKAAISELYTEVYSSVDGGTTIKRKLKLHSKIQAIDLLNKMLGFNAPEKKEVKAELINNINSLSTEELIKRVQAAKEFESD